MDAAAGMLGLLHLEVRSLEGGLKSPLLKKPCVRLGTRSLILWVVNSLNSLQALDGSHVEDV